MMAAPKRKTSKPAKPAGARILVVEARFYDAISDALLAGASKALDEARANWESIVVPGALEIVPAIAIAVEAAARQKKPYDGAVALGCVIQGETKHNDYINHAVAQGLTNVSLKTGKPVIFGVLTPNDQQQALDRAGGKHGNKGDEAAITAIKMLGLQKQVYSFQFK